ncbi:single-stranded-DNA-specific exonuclease RecJ, partial [Candidatus Peregrinibacteria bacterium]|nr:single-stranded-DNA-specific exonuclease RecJ [Candidatus Peregrinibacteria bacterium]
QNRNIVSEADRNYFFIKNPLSALHDPFLLKNMNRTLERIRSAVENRERMMIFGDYDADGITGTVIFFQTLKKIGAEVSYRLPDRQNDGYGLSEKFVQECVAQRVKVLITVDCGISCSAEISLAKKYGIDVIITDHHSIPEASKFPNDAFAIIHPKQKDCPYPDKEITGAGVAFKVAQALYSTHHLLQNQDFEHLMDLAGLGTVADCAPLRGENRHIVRHGLAMLKNTKNHGLKHLKKVAGIGEKEYGTEIFSYILAPRLNAAGRIAHPYFALQLLLSEDDKAERLAQNLQKLNEERQRMTRLSCDEASRRFGDHPEKLPILIAHDPNWKSGIIGLIAGKLKERYARPCIIMEDRGDRLVGSVRSPEHFSTIALLTELEDFLEHFGGHDQAGGFDMKKENLEMFQKTAMEISEKNLRENPIQNTLAIDCELAESDISFETYEMMKSLEPFGIGNEKPVFLVKDVTIRNIRTMGELGKHLTCTAELSHKSMRGVGFNLGEQSSALEEGEKRDLVCTLDKNDWNGNSSLELKIIDF